MKSLIKKTSLGVIFFTYIYFNQFTPRIFSEVPESFDDTNFTYIRELLNEKKTGEAQAEINKHLITYPSHPTLLLFQAETWIIQGEKSYLAQDFINAYELYKKANTLWSNHPLVKLRLSELKNRKIGINAVQDTTDYPPKKRQDANIEPNEIEEDLSYEKEERSKRKKKNFYVDRPELPESFDYESNRKELRKIFISPRVSSKEKKKQESLLLFAQDISKNISDLKRDYQILNADISTYEKNTDRKLESLEKKLDDQSDTFAKKETLYLIVVFMGFFIAFLTFLVLKLMGDINKILLLFIKNKNK